MKTFFKIVVFLAILYVAGIAVLTMIPKMVS